MHPEAFNYCTRWADHRPLRALDIGGRDINGHARTVWPNAQWTVIDLVEAPGVDIVGDAAVSLPDGPYDLVLCTEVFEHTPDWRKIVTNAGHALGPGGRLVVTCAGPGRPEHSGIDGRWGLVDGEHYENIPVFDLADAMTEAGLLVEDCRQVGTDTQGCGLRREVNDGNP